MLFQKKIQRAQEWLHQRNQPKEKKQTEPLPDAEELKRQSQEIKLEKGELPMMIFLALIIIVPVCLIVLLLMCSFIFFL